jgi:hypothetical protein
MGGYDQAMYGSYATAAEANDPLDRRGRRKALLGWDKMSLFSYISPKR